MSHSSQTNWEMCGNYFYTSRLKGETYLSLPNNITGVGKKSPSQRGNGKFWWREGLFHRVVKICRGVILTTLKAPFCKYWTWNRRSRSTGATTTAKNDGGRDKNLWRRAFFLVEETIQGMCGWWNLVNFCNQCLWNQ